jgi:hypothetical protein
LADIVTPNGFRWLASRRECADSLNALNEVNSSIREAIVMELEQLRFKTVQIADCNRSREINPQLSLVLDCYFQMSDPREEQFSPFFWMEIGVHGPRGTDQLDK